MARSSTSIRTSSPPTTRAIRCNRSAATRSTWSRDRPTPYDEMVAAMDQAGVAKAAIVQASTAYGHDNSYVAEAIAAYPKRFTGVFSVDMLAADTVEKMKHWLAAGLLRACGCSPPAAPCRARRPGSTIRAPIRPGSMPARPACRSACR